MIKIIILLFIGHGISGHKYYIPGYRNSNSLRYIEDINVNYIKDSDSWICGDHLKCPQYTIGCKVTRQTGYIETLTLFNSYQCFDRNWRKLDSFNDTLALPDYRLINIDLTTYRGAKNNFTLLFATHEEEAVGIVAETYWNEYRKKATKAVKTMDPHSPRRVNYVSH